MTKKIICVILMVIVILSVFYSQIYAADTVDSVISGADSFLAEGDSTINAEHLKTISDFIFNTLLAIAIIVAVIIGSIIGIQLMTESVEEKAKVKERLMPYLISCIVVFGAFGIWKLAVTILSGWTS